VVNIIVCSTRQHGVRRITAMDSNDKMMVQIFMQEEADATAEGQQRLLIFTSLLRLRQHIRNVPRRGSSRVEKALNKLARFSLSCT
jgi:hypothetical protein